MTHTTTHPQPPQALQRQRGFGLVELSISLTLIAALLLGAFYIVRSIRADTARKDFTEQATKVMATASKYLATYRSSFYLSTDLLIDMGAWRAEKKITHPVTAGARAATSTIPGAWEDVGRNTTQWTQGTGAAAYIFAYPNEGIVYRINRVPKANCSDVISELARYPSVAKVWARAWTANTEHPLDPTGTEVARGTNLNPSRNANVVLVPASITTVCANNYVEVLALVVRD